MVVTDILEIDSKRCKIYIDEQLAFALYKGEIRKLKIKVDSELSEEDYRYIIEDLLLKRAKSRSMYIIGRTEKSEAELIKKLKESFYPECVIEQTIDFLKEYKLIDDERYAREYYRYKSSGKSRKVIKLELLRKGIDKETISEVLEENDNDESELIKKLITKKKVDLSVATREEISKLYSFLLRKGFDYEDVTSVINKLTKYF